MGARTEYAPGTFCWTDLGTTDVDGAKAFYTGLFGWTFEGGDQIPYTTFKNGDTMNGGVMEIQPEWGDVPPHWAPYFNVGARLPAVTPARGHRRARVALLQGCVQRVFFHAVNSATASVLAAEGYEVAAPRAPRCCGALQLHSGYEPEALELARETISAFEGHDVVAVNAAGCGSSMKEYGHLLRDDPDWAVRAHTFSAKVRDVTELLAGSEAIAPRHPVPMKVVYHDACHLAHAQGIRAQPRALLDAIPGLELLEPPHWEICCGSAGVYNLLQPEAAAELGRRKAEDLIATGADAVVAGNPGCALQIQTHSEALGRPLRVYHPMEILLMSIEPRRTARDDGNRGS